MLGNFHGNHRHGGSPPGPLSPSAICDSCGGDREVQPSRQPLWESTEPCGHKRETHCKGRKWTWLGGWLSGPGIISLPEARSEVQVVRPARLKTCRQTAHLWGTQTTGESLDAAAEGFLTSMWLNAEGALWMAGNLSPGREQAHIQTAVLACDHVTWLSSHTSLGLW